MTLLAFAPAPEGGGGNVMGTLLMLVLFVAIFYFVLIRPQRQQQKQHAEMVKALKRGDEIVTIGGVIGRIVHVKDDQLTIKTADDTRIVIERDKVARTVTPQATSEES